MSSRNLTKLLPAPSLLRRAWLQPNALRHSLHTSSSTAGGLLPKPGRLPYHQRRPWPFGSNSLHNVPMVRTISFARVIPHLATKLLRIPAMIGGAAVAGLAYIQYQATRKPWQPDLGYRMQTDFPQRPAIMQWRHFEM